MKILFIDCKELFTEGLECLLETNGKEVEAYFATDVQTGIELIKEKGVSDLAFFDVSMFSGKGKHLIKEIKQLSSYIPVLIISSIETPIFERQAIEAGASGCVCKSSDKKSLFNAVETVLKGRVYSKLKPLKKDNLNNVPQMTITDRQFEVLNLMSQGLLNKQIANEMSISVNTVNAHIHDIFTRLKVTNRTAAIQSAHKYGLI